MTALNVSSVTQLLPWEKDQQILTSLIAFPNERLSWDLSLLPFIITFLYPKFDGIIRF